MTGAKNKLAAEDWQGIIAAMKRDLAHTPSCSLDYEPRRALLARVMAAAPVGRGNLSRDLRAQRAALAGAADWGKRLGLWSVQVLANNLRGDGLDHPPGEQKLTRWIRNRYGGHDGGVPSPDEVQAFQRGLGGFAFPEQLTLAAALARDNADKAAELERLFREAGKTPPEWAGEYLSLCDRNGLVGSADDERRKLIKVLRAIWLTE
ncbi:hypothetical protein [uncultured Paracoccus sp.]|uniref:hypothetical protein n=1 Tax=uncultured Paracoccus sp. TaxID=189685 RepID=UPI0025EF1DA5|nr:hypothetical protein [uncultured Paracoccus sp.]